MVHQCTVVGIYLGDIYYYLIVTTNRSMETVHIVGIHIIKRNDHIHPLSGLSLSISQYVSLAAFVLLSGK